MSLDWLANVRDIVLTGCALSGAIIAWRGVSAWQRELQGRTEYDLARRVLMGIYRVRDAIRRARLPLMTSSEYLDRPGRSTDTRHSDVDDLAYAYSERCKYVQETFTRLEVDLFEAEAIWHEEFRQCLGRIRSCVSELFISIESYIEQKRNPPDDREDKNYREKLKRVVYAYGTNDNPDEYAVKLSEAVEEFEKLLRPHLRRSVKSANRFRPLTRK